MRVMARGKVVPDAFKAPTGAGFIVWGSIVKSFPSLPRSLQQQKQPPLILVDGGG